MGKTSSKVKDRYNAKAYDELKIRVSKGNKDIIKAHAAEQGESLNGFVNRAIDEAMKRDSSSESGTLTTADTTE
ncbi:MAG: hypothetical protein ACI4FO_03160 [Acutalibacteraceae bacterium]